MSYASPLPTATPLGFALCHGWAFDKNFFQPLTHALQNYFPEAVYTFWDLGFSGPSHIPTLDPQYRWIALGHSYGFAHLLQTPYPWQAAIALNGFTRFCSAPGSAGSVGTPRRVIERMLNHLKSDLSGTITAFYQRCGTDDGVDHLSQTIENDKALFLHPANLLEQPLTDYLQTMRDLHLALPRYPLLVLAGTHDLIVPPALIAENFAPTAQIQFLESDHLLPLKLVPQCAHEIAQFVKQLYA